MTIHLRIAFMMILLVAGMRVVAEASDQLDEEALLGFYGDEEMISIATGNYVPISKAPAVATVITAEDIRAIGATDLDEVLETVPGLHVARDVIGYNPIYTFRGIYASFNPQVLVLINGIPITNLFQGDRNLMWGGMPVEAIARIEIIRGPGSALYGADAFAGVIDIITKSRGDIQRAEVGGRVGSFDTEDLWAVYGGDIGDFEVALVLEYHNTDGQREVIEADAQTGLDAALGTNASLAPGSVNLQRDNFDVRLDVARGDWRFRTGLQRRRNLGSGAGVAQALDPNNRYASDRWNADFTYDFAPLAEYWDVTAQLSYLDTSQEVERDLILFPPGTILPIDVDGNVNPVDAVGLVTFPDGLIGNPEVFERHARIGVSAFYTAIEEHLIRIGTGFNYGEIDKVRETKNFGIDPATGDPLSPGSPLVDVTDTPFVFLEEGDRKNYYLFLQDTWSFANDWELTAGLRHDDYSDFGGTTNPRLALVWSTRHDLTSKLLYGRAFRAPSFAQTRGINNPVVLGNPDLDPETIETLELAFDYRPTTDLRMELNVFTYRWEDIVLFVPDPGGVSTTAQNAGEQTGYGLELEADWQPTRDVRLLGNYAFQRSKDDSTDDDAGNAPRHQLYLRANWEFTPNWYLIPQVNWVLDRERVAADPRPGIDDYAIVDVTLRRKAFRDHWEAAVSVRNLFDAGAREPSPFGEAGVMILGDLPLAGRSIFGEIRYQF